MSRHLLLLTKTLTEEYFHERCHLALNLGVDWILMLEKNDSTIRRISKMLRRLSFRTIKTKVGFFLQTAPVLWRADAGSDISALFVDTDFLLLATSDAKGMKKTFLIIPFLYKFLQ